MSSDSTSTKSPPNPKAHRLKKLHVRHYPPGFQVEFQNSQKTSISIPREILSYLSLTTLQISAEKIVKNEPILQSKSKSRQEKIQNLVATCLKSIIETKASHAENIDLKKFRVGKILKAHVLPLTNVAFNKSGSLFLTGSYDRTAKIWPVHHLLGQATSTSSAAISQEAYESRRPGSGRSDFFTSTSSTSNIQNSSSNSFKNSPLSSGETITLDGHKNVVYTLAFNNPFGDKVATGSFDRTAKIWETHTGRCLQTLRGHSAEVVCLGFNSNIDPDKQLLATGSMDSRCGIWKVSSNNSIVEDLSEPSQWLAGHSGDVIALNWEPNENGSKLITGSFDRTAAVWDVESGKGGTMSPLFTLIGHREEISSVYLDYCGAVAITGSMDNTARIWDLRRALVGVRKDYEICAKNPFSDPTKTSFPMIWKMC